jgi:hypothetical protein
MPFGPRSDRRASPTQVDSDLWKLIAIFGDSGLFVAFDILMLLRSRGSAAAGRGKTGQRRQNPVELATAFF